MDERENIEEKLNSLKEKLKPEFLVKLDINQLSNLNTLLKELENMLND